MTPGPVFNWICVANSVAEILAHAARIRAVQLTARPTNEYAAPVQRKIDTVEKRYPFRAENKPSSRSSVEPVAVIPPILDAFPASSPPRTEDALEQTASTPNEDLEILTDPARLPSHPINSPTNEMTMPADGPVQSSNDTVLPEAQWSAHNRQLQSSKVPSSQIGRLFHYGGLALSLGYGVASEVIRRSSASAQEAQPPAMMTESNVRRLVSKLSQMRGAALKLGQFMSIQDTHILPPEVDKIFRRVQDSAHYMPDWQMEQVMSTSLGADWNRCFTSFNRIPFAAASIGQVHSAVLSAESSPTGSPARVAVKIQFPSIVNSIESDLGYIKLLLTAGKLLPKGLFLDRTIKVMKEELADECDYTREASFIRKFRSPAFLGNDLRFKVPWVWDESTDRVLVMEHVDGVNVGDAVVSSLTQRDRNDIASRILELCLKELFEFRVMQTDPNWTNFLWNPRTRQVGLVDFGATREYSKEFMDNWARLLSAAVVDDINGCTEWSRKLGYLTGEENDIMLDAHVKSMTLLATPFKPSTRQPFAFGHGSEGAAVTTRIRALIPVMLQNRLTPPPRETYSLNRKLSGAFLLASRLGASVNAKALWDDTMNKYRFEQ